MNLRRMFCRVMQSLPWSEISRVSYSNKIMHCKIIMKIPTGYSASENEEPVKGRKSEESNYPLPIELISVRSLNTANVRGLGTIFF